MILRTLIVGPLETNCYILADKKSKEAVVIDPGGDYEDIAREVKKLKLTVRHIILTHGHFDHTGALAQLKKATVAEILIHSADASMLSVDQTQPFFLESGSGPCLPDRYLSEGERIQFGEYALEVLHTPGHTPGSVSLVTDKVIFTGDTLFCGSVGRADLPGSSYRKLMDSIRTKLLNQSDDCVIYPGHGPASTIGEERKNNPFLTGM